MILCYLLGHIFTKEAIRDVGLLQSEGYSDEYNIDFARYCDRCGNLIDLRTGKKT